MRRHLCVLLAAEAVGPVHEWRRTWDPVMAAVVPPHVTVTYPEETANEDLLLRRAETCIAATTPFRLRLGEVLADDDGRGGVFVAVHDVDGGWSALRAQLLAEPMRDLGFPAHVTVAHPRTSSRGPECHAALAGRRVDLEVEVREVVHTETTSSTCTVLRRFALR